MKYDLFDIGTNRGEYTLNYLGKNPDSNVVCVEPNPKLYERLKSTLPEKVSILNLALSENEGQIEFYECIEDDTVSTVSKVFLEQSCFSTSSKIMANGKMFKDHYNYRDPITVKTTTLDKIIETYGNPELIKIDVEGHELEVLKGLTKKSGKITFEWHETFKDRIIECVRHLHGIGYEKFGTPIWESSSNYHDGEIPDSDYLSIEEFISYFSEKIDNVSGEKTWVERSGMIWVK